MLREKFTRSPYQLSMSARYSSIERQLPVALAGLRARGEDVVDERLGRPERAGHELAQGARDRAGEGRDVDEVGRAEPLRVGQRVGEDQPALGVRVGDVDPSCR